MAAECVMKKTVVLPTSIANPTIRERRMAKRASRISCSSLRVPGLAMACGGTLLYPWLGSLAFLVLSPPEISPEDTTPNRSHPSHKIFRSDRQPPDALAGRCKNRVAHRRCNQRSSGLSDPARRLIARHDVHLDLRHLIHAEHLVIVEIPLLHAPLIDCDFAFERGRQPENDCALHLRLNRQRIHRPPAIHRANHVMHLHLAAFLVHRDFGHLRHVAPKRTQDCDPTGSSGRRHLRTSYGPFPFAPASSSRKHSVKNAFC